MAKAEYLKTCDYERKLLIHELRSQIGISSSTIAKFLGISRSTLVIDMKRLGLLVKRKGHIWLDKSGDAHNYWDYVAPFKELEIEKNKAASQKIKELGFE